MSLTVNLLHEGMLHSHGKQLCRAMLAAAHNYSTQMYLSGNDCIATQWEPQLQTDFRQLCAWRQQYAMISLYGVLCAKLHVPTSSD